jgi:hypothetical protein
MPRYSKAIAMEAPVYVAYANSAAAGAQVDGYMFISDGYYEVDEVHANHDVNGGAGAAVDVKKVPSGTTIGSGSSVLASTFDFSTGADTKQSKTSANGGLTTTQANRRLSPGDALAADFSGTLTGLLGVAITVRLKRTRPID